MPTGLSVALALLAQTAPAAATQAQAPTAAKPADRECSPRHPGPDDREIVVCAIRPEGYRIDPDVLAAGKAKKQARAGGLKRPESFKQNDCATVGPMGCRGGAAINVLAAAMTAAEMAARLAKGQEIGSMFMTTPEPSEYELYKLAKQEREAKQAQAAAKAQAEARAAAAATAAPSTPR